MKEELEGLRAGTPEGGSAGLSDSECLVKGQW